MAGLVKAPRPIGSCVYRTFWLVDWETGFIGKGALEKAKADGVNRQLVGFTVDDAAAQVAEQAVVKVNGETAGNVTNFIYLWVYR